MSLHSDIRLIDDFYQYLDVNGMRNLIDIAVMIKEIYCCSTNDKPEDHECFSLLMKVVDYLVNCY